MLITKIVFPVSMVFLLCVICHGKSQAEKKPGIQNMERLNTSAHEDDPLPSSDVSQFLYSSDSSGTRQLYLSVRPTPAEPWGAGKLVDELSGEGECRSAFLLPKNIDGWEYLYFATQYRTDKTHPNYDIYRVGRFNSQRPFQGYSAAGPIQAIASEADEAFPWVSVDGKELYFSRKTNDGWKLLFCVAKAPHVFEKPEEISLEAGFHHATLSRSGLVMILQGPLKKGGTRQGLYVCRRQAKNEPWGEPKPISSVNSEDGTMGTCSPSLSSDNRFLYFSSDRPGGKGGLDLYVVPVTDVKELRK